MFQFVHDGKNTRHYIVGFVVIVKIEWNRRFATRANQCRRRMLRLLAQCHFLSSEELVEVGFYIIDKS